MDMYTVKLLVDCSISAPDLAFIVSYLSKSCIAPTTAHWCGIKRVFRYLKQTIDYHLVYIKTDNVFNPIVFSDSDYANDSSDSKSIGGFVVIACNGAISWRSRKQTVVATCTMLAEYYSMYEACKEIIWLRDIMTELNLSVTQPTELYCDNQGAISLAKGNKISERSKHCRMRYHYVRECVSKNEITLSYIPTSVNPADIMT